ncbi:M48 family metallopeptidase [Anaerolinea thermophila]|uniref:M48 family metallopeptidase n=2 Tax=Anaerolinea TaxID=233189 RepID=UPI0026E9B5F3|nr:SprT family zinc-dependent metalloprotease [Anaerolinea thermophila]
MGMESVQIVRSRRKTIAIQITPDGQVILRLPLTYPKAKIPEILAQYHNWIEEKVQKFQTQKKQVPQHKFSEGETFLYLGKEYPLHLTHQTSQPLFWNEDGFWLRKTDPEQARKWFLSWYQEKALAYFTERARAFEKKFTHQTYQIKLSNARSRWGSCSSRGVIRLSWRLIMAPPDIIDSVIVHELAHFVHPNHSKEFWNLVSTEYPDYKKARRWLRNFGHLLVI